MKPPLRIGVCYCGPYLPMYGLVMAHTGIEAELLEAQTTVVHLTTRIQELETKIDGLTSVNSMLTAANATLTAARDQAHCRMAAMLRQIKTLARKLYGSNNEGHHADPAVVKDLLGTPDDQADDDPAADDPAATTTTGDGPAPVDAAPEKAGAAADTTTPAVAGAAVPPPAKPPRRKPGGRMHLPEWLALQEEILDVPLSERIGLDGQQLSLISMAISWRLDFVQAHFERVKISRPVYGRPFGDGLRIVAPPKPAIVPNGLPTDRLVAQVVVEKYDSYLPLYRQENRLENLGVVLTRATLMNWVAHSAVALSPIQQAIGVSVREQPVLGLDDTYLPVLVPGLGKCHQGRLWGYLANEEFFCEYRATREGQWPEAFLKNYTGTVLGDAYSGHKGLFTSGQRTPAGCLGHARRKFDAAKKMGETIACRALDHFAALYAVEERVRDRPPDEILAARKATSVPIMDKLETLLLGWLVTELPSSATWISANYTLKIYKQLREFTRDGRVAIDNNALERCWRGVGIGRRNWLFAGSARGGTWTATHVTICQSCRLVGLDPFTYLTDVFAELNSGRRDYINLRPAAWASQKQASEKAG